MGGSSEEESHSEGTEGEKDEEQGKEEEAITYLHKGYELFPDNSYMLVELINYYLNSGESEKAEVYLDAAIKQDPNNASFYRAKGI